MAASKGSVVTVRWTEEEYQNLHSRALKKGQRDMWLAIRIAAHTGASASGLASLEIRDDEQGRSVFLNETKRDHRPRVLPCHPEIYADVKEWQIHKLSSAALSRKFGRQKNELGYTGRDKTFHCFRNSCVYQLENAKVSDREIKRVMGHKLGSVTYDSYNMEGLSYDVMRDVIILLNWSEVGVTKPLDHAVFKRKAPEDKQH